LKGKLIVFEGLDGSGKDTQANLSYKKLVKKNIKVLTVSFPDYNEPSSILVKMYLNAEFGEKPTDVNAFAASSFYAVDRFVSFNKIWKKKYENGYIILADRYTTSNAIYQLSKLEKKDWNYYLEWLCDYEYNKLMLPRPNLTLYLDVPIEVSQSLMLKRYNGKLSKRDMHEENLQFLKLCQEAAFFSGEKLGWKFINCCRKTGDLKTINEINYEILEKIKNA
jgi:dTMP kinase